MYGIQPRSLTTQELIAFGAELIGLPHGMPKDFQAEILRRLTVLAPDKERQYRDPKQLELFL